jgi:hypothetical protein
MSNYQPTVNESTIHEKIMHVYIIYCNIIMPLFLSIIPAIVILILNLTLWFFMKNYTKTISSKPIETNARTNKSFQIKRQITKSQKSHYFTIIIMGIWLLFTQIPYNVLTTHYWISELRLMNIKTRLSLTIQGISSAFFNLNHCLNIIIYILFHKDFRLCLKNLLIKLICHFTTKNISSSTRLQHQQTQQKTMKNNNELKKFNQFEQLNKEEDEEDEEIQFN